MGRTPGVLATIPGTRRGYWTRYRY